METSKAVIGRPSKLGKLVSGLKSYVSAAQADSTLPLTVLAISRAIGIRKSTIYLHQHEPEVAEQLNLIRRLAIARKRASSLNDAEEDRDVEDSDPDLLAVNMISEREDARRADLDVLAVRAGRAIQKAVWSMNRFIGRHRKHRYMSDLPRVVYDLDITLAELRLIRGEVGTLCDDWRQIAKNSTADQEVTEQLILPNIAEE